jgi:glycosyltransferase involved in cell wall biosynthesis
MHRGSAAAVFTPILMPRVSIILPTFNRTRLLRMAVESVFAQTYTDWELIIADDGSADETRDYLSALNSTKVRIVWLQHSANPSRVRNAAIAAASGAYLAFLDSDDLWARSKLQIQLAVMCSRANTGWSYTACEHIDADGKTLPKKTSSPHARPEGWIFDKLLTLQIGIAMPTVIAERRLVDEAGRFDEQQLYGEFHEFCLRLAMRSQVASLPQALCYVRVHDEHYGTDRVGDRRGWMRLYQKMSVLAPDARLRAYCRRRRAETSLQLARALSERREYGEVRACLASALPYSWRYPHWWWGAARRVLSIALGTGP